MELLILLASREGQLVTRSEIADRLWASESSSIPNTASIPPSVSSATCFATIPMILNSSRPSSAWVTASSRPSPLLRNRRPKLFDPELLRLYLLRWIGPTKRSDFGRGAYRRPGSPTPLPAIRPGLALAP